MGNLESLLLQHTNALINIAFGIIFCVVGWYCVTNFFQPLNNKLNLLSSVSEILNKYNRSSIVDHYEEFVSELNTTDFKPLWQQYEKTILKVTDDEGVTELYATEEAADYISVSAVLSDLKITFFKSCAGVFTGIGILGTFAGLTLGLFQLDASTTKGLQEGITGLLGGMSAAFITSIIGIGLALFYNWQYSVRMKKIGDKVNELCNTVDNLFPHESVISLLNKNYQESKERTNQIKDFNSDLVIRLGALFDKSDKAMNLALNDSFKENLVPVLERLNTAIENLNQGGVAELRDGLQKGAGEQLTSFAESVKQLQANLEETMKRTQEISNDNNAKLQMAIDSLVTKLNTAADANIQSQKQGAEDNNKAMRELILELNTNLKTAISQMMDSSAKANKALVEATGKASATVDRMTAYTEANAGKQQQVVNEAASQFKETLTETLAHMREEMNQHDAAMKAVLDNLNAVMTNNKAVVDSAGEAAAQFAKASAPVQQAADAMGTQLARVLDASDRFSRTVSDDIEQMGNASKMSQDNLEDIQKSLATMQKAWTAYADHFEKVNGEMSSTFETLQEGMQDYNATVRRALGDSLSQFDESIKTSLDGISGIANELNYAAEQLAKASSKKK